MATFSVSTLFSMMGAGGSQILVPLLFWLGMDFKSTAIPLALLASAVTCLSAGLFYLRKGLVKISTATPFALAVLVGSPAGAVLARPATSRFLMFFFALTNIVVGALVLRGRGLLRDVGRKRELVTAVAVGLGIGFMIGFVARDGGPFTMAVLVLLGMDPRKAAGTTPLIVAAGCAVAFTVHSFAMDVSPSVLLLVAAGALFGSQLGARFMARRLDSRRVRILSSSLMMLSGFIIMVQALTSG